LYVADYENNRVQKFQILNGTSMKSVWEFFSNVFLFIYFSSKYDVITKHYNYINNNDLFKGCFQ
jgi:hypothetical protein